VWRPQSPWSASPDAPCLSRVFLRGRVRLLAASSHQECERSLDDPDKEIAVLKNVPSTDHVHLDKYPDHQTDSKDCTGECCVRAPAKSHDSSDKLTDPIHEEQDDPWNEEIAKWGSSEHLQWRLQEISQWMEDKHQPGDSGADSDKNLDDPLSDKQNSLHETLVVMKNNDAAIARGMNRII